MEQYPKITIITPSFNQGPYIEATICSVVEQGYPNLEYLIIDGGSTDNTVPIIKKYADHITYWESQPDRGQAHAINKGLRKATGAIFNWINSDDLLAPNSLFTIARLFRDANVQVVCGECEHIDGETGQPVGTATRTLFYESPERTLVDISMGQPSQFYRLPIVRELGLLEESFRYSMDLELWFRYLFKHGTQHITGTSETLSQFRTHPASKTVAEGAAFSKDDNAIYHTMLSQCGAPGFLTAPFAEPRNTSYQHVWNFSLINPVLLQAFMANKLATRYYTQHDYALAKKCMEHAAQNSYPRSLGFYWKYAKFTAMPTGLLKGLRRWKHALARK